MCLSGFIVTIGFADDDPAKCLSHNTIFTSYFHLQCYHDSPLHRNKDICHIAPPLTTKCNTTCIRHTLMDTKFHHCGGTHCLGHSDLNEMCELWVTVTGHLQVTVTLSRWTAPLKKEPSALNKLASILVSTGIFPPNGLYATKNHPTNIPHPIQGNLMYSTH